MSAVRTLRAARSAPNLRRGIKHSIPTTNPSSLLNSSQYTSLSVQALKTECRKKGLKVSGKKSELIDRLSSHDASRLTNTGIADIKFASTKSGGTTSGYSSRAVKSTPTTPKKQQVSRKQATAATANWQQEVDRIKLPAGWQMQDKSNEPPFKIPVPPDAYRKTTSEAHTEYTTPMPDGAGASVHQEKVHVLGKTSVRSLEDDSKISKLTNEGGEYDHGSSDQSASFQPEEMKAKDRSFLAGFAAVVTGWWLIGKAVDKRKEKHDKSTH